MTTRTTIIPDYKIELQGPHPADLGSVENMLAIQATDGELFLFPMSAATKADLLKALAE